MYFENRNSKTDIITLCLIATLCRWSSSLGLRGVNNKDRFFQGMLADFVSQTSPMIPAIIVSCVNEIEQRGLTEVRVDS